jgi:lysine 6-dehydrogenase
MVSILAMHGANRFDDTQEIHIRVGGLPQNPKPPLDYQLVFSVEGLINEYVEKARVIRGGTVKEIESMTELESLAFENFPRSKLFKLRAELRLCPKLFWEKSQNSITKRFATRDIAINSKR